MLDKGWEYKGVTRSPKRQKMAWKKKWGYKWGGFYTKRRLRPSILPHFSVFGNLRATLDEGPRSRDQWIQAILLVESFKLVPRPWDKGSRPKSGEFRLNLHGTCFGGRINWFGPKNIIKRRAPDLENQELG
jgi:hypothetical protein